MSPLEFHPLADFFPLLDGQDFAELVTDLPSSTSAFVLRRSTSFCRRPWTPVWRAGLGLR